MSLIKDILGEKSFYKLIFLLYCMIQKPRRSPLSCQELTNDKKEVDEKKWNLGDDRLKAKISPGISGYKKKKKWFQYFPKNTGSH